MLNVESSFVQTFFFFQLSKSHSLIEQVYAISIQDRRQTGERQTEKEAERKMCFPSLFFLLGLTFALAAALFCEANVHHHEICSVSHSQY